jgi:hypothetical protein
LRLRPVFRLNLPADLRLAPSFNLPAPPSNLTSNCRRPSYPFGAAVRLPAACAADSPSSPACGLTSDSGCCISGSALRLVSGCAFNSPARLTFELNLQFPGCCILRRCHPAKLRLAPPIHLPALPADPTSDSLALHLRRHLPVKPSTRVSGLPSGCFPAHLQLALATNLPAQTLAVNLRLAPLIFLRAAFRSNLPLALPTRSSGCLPIELLACASNRPSGPAFELNFRLTARHQ